MNKSAPFNNDTNAAARKNGSVPTICGLDRIEPAFMRALPSDAFRKTGTRGVSRFSLLRRCVLNDKLLKRFDCPSIKESLKQEVKGYELEWAEGTKIKLNRNNKIVRTLNEIERRAPGRRGKCRLTFKNDMD